MKRRHWLSLAAFALCLGENAWATDVSTWTPTWTATPTTAAYYINSVAVSANASRTVGGTFFHSYGAAANDPAAAATGQFGTYCYDRAGRLLWKDEFVGWQGVYWVDISSDGAWAASGGWFSQTPKQGFVRAYDASTGKTVLDYPTTTRVNQVALSADGAWLASGANALTLFHRVNGTYRKTDEFTPSGTANVIETLALSADGRTVITGDSEGHIQLFIVHRGKLDAPKTWTITGGGYSHCVRVTPSGKTFVAGGSDGRFYLFDTARFRQTPQPTVTYQVPQAGSVYGVAVAADGQAFAGIVNTGSTGSVYYVTRHGGTGKLKWSYATQHNPNSVWIHASTHLVAVADGHPDGTPGAFYILNAATGALKAQYVTSNMSWPIMISGDGAAIAAGSDNTSIYYFAANVD